MKMNKLKYYQSVAISLVLLSVTSWAWAGLDQRKETADEFPSDLASIWFEQLYDVVKAEKVPPPEASRIYGVTAVALYESIVAGTEENRSLVGQLNGLMSLPRPKINKKYHWPTVANAAFFNTILGLFPGISEASLDTINDLALSFASQQKAVVPGPVYERSISLGQAVAAAILGWAATDGFQIYSNCEYVPLPVPGAWEPTPPLFNPHPLQPCWGMMRPMVLTSGEECSPQGHPAFSTDAASDFYAAGLRVYHVGLSLTDELKTIADYWSDGTAATGTPPGHWIAIVSQIARNKDISLVAAAEAYARVGMAVHDAFIACWYTKYIYNLQRPVTYIRDNIDAGWTPYIVTPVFPSYTSGHSVQSAAAARVLTDMFGVMSFTDTTLQDHGLVPSLEPRAFNSFDEAAAEAALSRLYAGIHFPFDINDGLTSGRCIGQVFHDRVSFRDGSDKRE